MNTVYITDVASFMPNAPVDNDNVEVVLGKIPNQPARAKTFVLQNNGIKTRHYAIDPATGKRSHTNAQITAEAVRKLVAQLDMPLDKIEGLACGTSSADQMIPSHSNMAAGELELPFIEIVSTAGVCASGMTALKYAYMNIAMGLHKNFVATGSERASAYMQTKAFAGMLVDNEPDAPAVPMVSFEKEFLRWMLSDGAGAVMLEPQPRPDRLNLRIEGLDVRCASGFTPVCMYHCMNKDKDGNWSLWTDEKDMVEAAKKGYLLLQQDVRALEQNMVKVAVEGLKASQEMWNFQWEEIDWFLPHLSSMYFKGRMNQGMAEAGINIPEEKWFTNLTTKGNVGSASIFVIMDEIMHSGRVKKGQKIYCAVPESGRFTVAGMLCTVV